MEQECITNTMKIWGISSDTKMQNIPMHQARHREPVIGLSNVDQSTALEPLGRVLLLVRDSRSRDRLHD